MFRFLLPAVLLASPVLAQAPPLVEFDKLTVLRRPPSPPYPPIARIAQVQGRVVLSVTIGPTGLPEAAQPVSGPALLRAASVADALQWAFAPVQIEGKPARIRTTFAMPYTLKDAPQPARETGGGRIVVQLGLIPSPLNVPVDLPALEWEVLGRLTRAGLQVADPAAADPGEALHLQLNLQAARAPDAIQLLNLQARCSLLADRDLARNTPGEAQRIWFDSHVSGRVEKADFQDEIARAFRESLDTLLGGPEAPAPLPESSTRTVEFKQMKIRYQPPAPPYPGLARERRVEGVVVVHIMVDPAGMPTRVEALTGPPELIMTAVRYALQWRFDPVLLDGVPQAARFKLTLPFRLRAL